MTKATVDVIVESLAYQLGSGATLKTRSGQTSDFTVTADSIRDALNEARLSGEELHVIVTDGTPVAYYWENVAVPSPDAPATTGGQTGVVPVTDDTVRDSLQWFVTE